MRKIGWLVLVAAGAAAFALWSYSAIQLEPAYMRMASVPVPPSAVCKQEDQPCGPKLDHLCIRMPVSDEFACLAPQDAPVRVLSSAATTPFQEIERIAVDHGYVVGGIGGDGRTECRITSCREDLAGLDFSIGSIDAACSRLTSAHENVCRAWGVCEQCRQQVSRAYSDLGIMSGVNTRERIAAADCRPTCDAILGVVAKNVRWLAKPHGSSGRGISTTL